MGIFPILSCFAMAVTWLLIRIATEFFIFLKANGFAKSVNIYAKTQTDLLL
jgi:hypothetical protein